MHSLSKIFKGSVSLLIALFILAAGAGQAQQPGNSGAPKLKKSPQSSQKEIPYSDEELKKFAGIMKDSRSVRTQSRKRIRKKVKESPLNGKTYQKMEIHKKRKGKLPDSTSEANRKAFKQLQQEMKQVEKDFKKKMDSTISEHGMEKAKFKKMARTMQKNKAMQKKVQKMVQG